MKSTGEEALENNYCWQGMIDKYFDGNLFKNPFDSEICKSCRKSMCKEFGLTVTHTIFSSDFSNRNAAKAGFKTDVSLR